MVKLLAGGSVHDHYGVCAKKGNVGEWQCPGEDKKINCDSYEQRIAIIEVMLIH